MGMAASQARYLGLSARKTNVEFEGQQVNQQRTALANESAGLFRRMLALDVPTAPAKSDYQTDVYTYNEPKASDGKATATNFTLNEGSDPETYSVDIRYNVDYTQYGYSPQQTVNILKEDDKLKVQLANGQKMEISKVSVSEQLVKEMNKAANTDTNSVLDEYYRYYNPASQCYFYINATDSGLNTEIDTSQTVDVYTSMAAVKSQTETLKNVSIGKSADGLYSTMFWTDEYGVSQTRTLSVGQEYDDVAYQNAMEKYNADKDAYDKEIADINAKTEELQETDRTLELRLKQLDTEQQALQTEMESIKKVIDKQVETVFKTFQ